MALESAKIRIIICGSRFYHTALSSVPLIICTTSSSSSSSSAAATAAATHHHHHGCYHFTNSIIHCMNGQNLLRCWCLWLIAITSSWYMISVCECQVVARRMNNIPHVLQDSKTFIQGNIRQNRKKVVTNARYTTVHNLHSSSRTPVVLRCASIWFEIDRPLNTKWLRKSDVGMHKRQNDSTGDVWTA